jgi:zinc D-Ala-D-Ala dipeptidase
MTLVKPYRAVPIRECGEHLAPVPVEMFKFFDPHPYVALGAPYGQSQPWMLRESILESLQKAQNRLPSLKPGWRIILFDAYRPNSVQSFMVNLEVENLAKAAGQDPKTLSPEKRGKFLEKAYRVFAIPSDDPATPPPHSTGAAIDLTLIDERGDLVDMGSPLDENSDRSYPDYYMSATEDHLKKAHANRLLLNKIMSEEGFMRNPGEWWHFSKGDQLATWLKRDEEPNAYAIYGRADLIDATTTSRSNRN